jgi:hypothetical protein
VGGAMQLRQGPRPARAALVGRLPNLRPGVI